MDEIITYINANTGTSIAIAALVITALGVALGLMNKVIFYNDYNDLGVSAATIAIPALILASTFIFYKDQETIATIFLVAATAFIGFFIVMAYKTFMANNMSVVVTLILIVAKLVMSFIFVLHLFNALTAKKRATRGQSWFVLAILTPLLLALVHTKEGSFRLTATGRPRM